MAIIEKLEISRLWPLIDLQVHHVAVKRFNYHETASFPYNLLILVTDADDGADNYFDCPASSQHIPLEKGHFYILPRQLPIRFRRTPEVPGITMRFNLSFFYGMDVFDNCRAIRGHHDPSLVGRIQELVSGKAVDLRMVLALKSAVTDACLACWPATIRELNPTIWKYEQVFQHVRENCDARLSVSDLADVYGARQDVFSRAFTRDVGVPPKKYIADELLKRVAVLLLSTEFSIREIADELVFSSEYYLSRFFKKGTGMPPSEYRMRF